MAVNSARHKDKRTNIPTEKLRDFVAGDEAQRGCRIRRVPSH
jgi:hypothetical protein